MEFQPRFCPCRSPLCETHPGFQYQRRGTFKRACDGRVIQRYQCKRCKRTFSAQTFRVDYRHHKPHLDHSIFLKFVGKVTQRQTTRDLHCTRATVARRVKRYGEHCRAFHMRVLAERDAKLVWDGPFVLDELETYEHNRRLKPLTVPLLVHKQSRCIVHAAVGTLPARKPLSPKNLEKLQAQEAADGKRLSESRAKVAECFDVLQTTTAANAVVNVRMDQKHTYRALLKKRFGDRLVHETTHSSAPRTVMNPLFVINHTFAMLRDGLSRLVRRTWAASKKREPLGWHLWIYIAWRNYIRPITNKRPHETAAMVAGLVPRMLEVSDLLQWRIFHPRDAQLREPASQGPMP